MATRLELAYNQCQSIAKKQAKNFYYAFRTLPPKKRRAIYAAYAFCRLCDDIADEEMPLNEKRHLFVQARERLRGTQNGHKHDPIFEALDDASAAFGIPKAYFNEVIQGVEIDLSLNRFQAFEDLRTYCYGVASVVGLICIEIFGYDDPKAKDYAVDLGIAMQLTNILRDIREDAERDRIYIPLDEMAQFGYSEAELMDGIVNDAFHELMKFQVSRARHYFDSSVRLLPLLSPECRVCPAMLHRVYRTILDRIETSGFNVFEKRIGLTTSEKILMMARIWLGSLISAAPLPRQ